MQRLRPTHQTMGVSQKTSVEQVQSLISTGIGCIAYLRELFPEDSFEDQVIIARQAGSSSSQDDRDKRGVKVKRLVRSACQAGNSLMDYVETGVFDAVDKGYLRELLFAIYLDPEDPTSVVELYTFTFSYSIDNQGKKHPELEVRNRLKQLVVSSREAASVKTHDLESIKRQSQKLIKKFVLPTHPPLDCCLMSFSAGKSIVAVTQNLESLPKRRFLTLRLYYTDDTPDSYEPPYFHATEDDHFTVSTAGDVPDFHTLGSLQTGRHGVTVKLVTISPFLEVAPDDNISASECLSRNRADAATRPIVWDAQNQFPSENVMDQQGEEPIGIKSQGVLRTIEEIQNGQGDEMDVLKEKLLAVISTGDVSKIAPILLKEKGKGVEMGDHWRDNDALDMAVDFEDGLPVSSQSTQIDPVHSRQKSTRVPTTPLIQIPGESSQGSVDSGGVARTGSQLQEAQSFERLRSIQEEEEEEEEVPGGDFTPGQIPLFSVERRILSGEMEQDTPIRQDTRSSNKGMEVVRMKSLRTSRYGLWAKGDGRKFRQSCECGLAEDDGAMVQCSSCSVWKHMACYGYESLDDPQLATDFYCYPCRALGPVSGDSLDHERDDEIKRVLLELDALALFRRALFVLYDGETFNAQEFDTRLGVDQSSSQQMIKRLLSENFLLRGKIHRRGAPSKILNRTPAQLALKSSTYFSPGHGAELGLTLLLDSTDDDADGEEEFRTPAPSASFKQQAAPNASPPAPQDSSSNRVANAPAKPAAVLATPLPRASNNVGPSIEIVPATRTHSMVEEDPIVDPDEESSAGAKKPRAAPYVPNFKRAKDKGKGKENSSIQSSAFHRASSSFFQEAQTPEAHSGTALDSSSSPTTPDAMQVDPVKGADEIEDSFVEPETMEESILPFTQTQPRTGRSTQSGAPSMAANGLPTAVPSTATSASTSNSNFPSASTLTSAFASTATPASTSTSPSTTSKRPLRTIEEDQPSQGGGESSVAAAMRSGPRKKKNKNKSSQIHDLEI